jgi:peptidoglycan/LPS O-acetylase OafA/YrhL
MQESHNRHGIDARSNDGSPHEGASASEAPAAGRSPNIPYLLGVDHMRALAALLILYYHGVQAFWHVTRHGGVPDGRHWLSASDPLSALIAEGHTAVALFMVLSGFILAYGATGKKLSYRQFASNRFLRTYPLFIFVVLVGVATSFSSVSIIPLLQLLLGGAAFPGAQDLGAFSAVLWSVSVEWQFYLIFPALMLMLNRSGPSGLLAILAMVLAARGLAYLQGLKAGVGLYSFLLGRLDQFMLGMIAGWYYARRPSLGPWRFVVPLGPALVLAGALLWNRFGGYPREHWVRLFTPTLEGAVWTAVVAGYVAMLRQSTARPGVVSRAFAAIGACSYSIYIWHYAIIEAQRRNGWVPLWLESHELNAALVTTLTTAPAVLVFSAISYTALEKPFFHLRKRYLKGEAASTPLVQALDDERVSLQSGPRHPEGRRPALDVVG